MISIRTLAAIALFVLTPLTAAAEESAPIQVGPAESTVAPPAFEQLLAESDMRFEVPTGFEPVEVRQNPLFLYDRAIVSPDGALEIRYAVRPLGRIVVDYEDPHSSAPDPNHMFPVMFQSMVTLLSNGRHSPTGEYPPEQAAEKFNADWASASVFDISAEFNAGHRQALVIAMHKNGMADAYAVFLFDDYEQVKQQINDNLDVLTFLP